MLRKLLRRYKRGGLFIEQERSCHHNVGDYVNAIKLRQVRGFFCLVSNQDFTPNKLSEGRNNNKLLKIESRKILELDLCGSELQFL